MPYAMASITRRNLDRSSLKTAVSSPSTVIGVTSRKVWTNSAALLSKDLKDTLCANRCAVPVALRWLTITLRTYSTSGELSRLCASHERTVQRFVRKPSGKKEKGGTCSLVTPSASHI